MAFRFLTSVTLALSLVSLAGCGKQKPQDKVVSVPDDDPRMNAAMEKARSSVQTFIAALKAPKASQSRFAVKMAFSDGEHTEHMWLTPVSYDGKRFQGTINNDPQTVKTVKMGQKVSAEPSKISDWMFVENRKLVGGYAIRVLRDAVPTSERAELDKSVPFIIE